MLTPENLAALVLHLSLVMYALFGGADFGGGIWTAFSSGPRAREQRDALFLAIGPVWETNNVWLIFMVVTLFTAFPGGFAPLFIALMVPFVLALVGVLFRGAAFAFRHFGRQIGEDVPLWAKTFEIASIVTPFAFGIAVAATAAGGITLVVGEVQYGPSAWLSPFTLVGGVVGMAICAYLAPVYMTVRTTGELQQDFRRRGITAGFVLGILTTLEVPVAMAYAPQFAGRLFHSWPVVFVCLAICAGLATQLLLLSRHFLSAQILAAATVTMTITGFSSALYPDLLIGQLSLAAAAAPRPTLVAYLTVLPIGFLILIPSLVFLYWTFRRDSNAEPSSNHPG